MAQTRAGALKLILVVALLGFLAGAAGACARNRSQSQPPASAPPPPVAETPEPSPPPPEEPEGTPSPFSGLRFAEAALARRPLLFVVDNHPSARPQSGLQQAELVYEVLAEGGITRLLALYLGPDVEEIGPIRSIRHYFLDLAVAHDAILVYVGQSPQSQAELAELRVAGLNEFSNGTAFWRSTSRPMPHNLYTSTDLVRQAARRRGLERSAGAPPGPFSFEPRFGDPGQAGPPAGAEATRGLTVHYPGYVKHRVGYRYDPETEEYVRSVADRPHLDARTRQALRVKTILLQVVPTRAIPGDPEGRLDVQFTGKGGLVVVTHGARWEGSWRRADRTAAFDYLDADGRPLVLPPGPVWVQVIPADARVEYEGE